MNSAGWACRSLLALTLVLAVTLVSVRGLAAGFDTLWNYSKIEAGNRNELTGLLADVRGGFWLLSRFEDANQRGRCTLSKLDAQGSELWSTNLADGTVAWPARVAVNGAGAVVGVPSTNGIQLLRFDFEGRLVWQITLPNPDGRFTYVGALAWSTDDQIWLAGNEAVAKISATGERVWVQPLFATTLQALPGGEMAALTYTGVRVIAPSGEIRWQADDFVDRQQYPKGYSGTAMVVADQSGSIFVGGLIEDAITVAKYTADGLKLWQTEYQGKSLRHETMPDDFPSSLQVHASGAVTVAGRSKGVSYQETDFFTMMLAADGRTLWRARERIGGQSAWANGLAIDPSGHSYAMGGFVIYTNGQYVVHAQIAKYSLEGARLGRVEDLPTPAEQALIRVGDGRFLVYGNVINSGTSGFRLTMFRERNEAESVRLTEPLADRLVAEGERLVLAAPATGVEPLRYQWLSNDIPIAGATGPSLALPAARLDQAGDYSVEISDAYSVVTSSDATITVSTVPTIPRPPLPQSALLGGQARFTVGASSTTPVTFQWWKDGQAIDGAVANGLALSNLNVNHAGRYYASARSFAGSSNSPSAQLRVFTCGRQAWKTTLAGTYFVDDFGYPNAMVADAAGNVVIGTQEGTVGSALFKLDSAGRLLWRVHGLLMSHLAQDLDGSIYFAGTVSRSNHVHLGKINAAGSVLWKTVVASPATDFYISSFALDSSNNVTAVGYRGSAMIALRCDREGNRLWVAAEQTPQAANWQSAAVAAGPPGRLYLAGAATGGADAGAWLFALNAAGQLDWQARLGAVDDWHDQPAKAVVDSAGNIAVLSRGNVRNSFALESHDPAGSKRWRYEPTFDPAAVFVPFDVAVSTNDELTVAGYLMRWSTTSVFNEWILKRVDRNGRELWSASQAGNSDQRLSALQVDPDGRVYVAGGYGTFCYSENGMLIWQVDTIDAFVSAMDRAGNFYTASPSLTGGSSLMSAARYEPTAERNTLRFLEPWPSARLAAAGAGLNLEARLEGVGPFRFQWTVNGEPLPDQTNQMLHIQSVGVEHAGRMGLEIYGPAGLLAYPQFDLRVATKPVIVEPPHNAEQVVGGEVRLSVNATGTSPLRYQWLFKGRDLAHQTNSSLVLPRVSGGFAGEYTVRVSSGEFATLSPPAHVTVFTSMRHAWVRSFSNSARPYRTGQHVTFDRSGDIYVLGSTGPSYPADFTVLRYDPEGTLAWSRSESFDASASQGIAGYAWDAAGGLILVGSQGYTGTAVTRTATDGTASWSVYDAGPGGSYAVARAVAVHNTDVYVTGESADVGESVNYGTFKLVPNGNQMSQAWARRFATTPVQQAGGRAIVVDGNARIFVAGTSGTLRYESDGRLTWSALGFDDRAIIADAGGNVFVVGRSLATGAPPAFVLRKYGPAGELVWASSYPIPGAMDPPRFLFLDSTGSVFAAGPPGVFHIDVDGRVLWANTNISVSAAARYRSGVVVGGIRVGESVTQYLTVALDGNGRQQWSAQFQDYSAAEYLQSPVRGLAASPDGRVYVTGRSGGNIVTICYAPEPVDAMRLFAPTLIADGSFQCVLRAPIGQAFRIQTSSNLSSWSDWMAGRATDPDTYFIAHPSTNGSSRQFFRAVSE